MAKAKTTFDVFVAHSHSDEEVTQRLIRILEAYDLRVFAGTGPELLAGQDVENVIWEAMSESQAMVAIIPEADPGAWIAFELGAAKAWNKPIYAVAPNPAVVRLPAGFREMLIYPVSRIEELGQKIKDSLQSMSESHEAVLIEEYHRVGVPVDQLLLQPNRLSQLTKQFKKRANRNISSEDLVRSLLRLRKRGKLRGLRSGKHPK